MSILNDLSEYIRAGESSSQNLGLEIEHFVINEEGIQITFDEISPLIHEVGTAIGAELLYMDGYTVGYDTGKYTTSLEPSCQFEISIFPSSDLDEIKEIYQDFRDLWDPIFAELGYHFENGGNLPLVEQGIITPDDIPLSPKHRYKYMNQRFLSSGRFGKYMMRASASTQVSIDYFSETDMQRKLSILEKISPILMILMETKHVADFSLPGLEGKTHLLRTQEWDDLDPVRTGYLKGSLSTEFGYDDIANIIYHTPLILLTDEGKTTFVDDKSAFDLITSHVIREDKLTPERRKNLLLHFMSMGFFHFRIKNYIEIRVADSVPIERALGYSALIKGLMYSEESLDRLDEILESVTTIDEIQNAVEAIEYDGFDALIYDDKSAREWADILINIAEETLDENDKEYLHNVRVVWSNS